VYSNIVLTVVGDFPHAAKAPNLPLWSCAHLHDPPDTPSGRNSLAQPGRPQSQPASDAWKTLGKLSILRRNDLVLSVIILWSILFVSNFPMEIAHRKKHLCLVPTRFGEQCGAIRLVFWDDLGDEIASKAPKLVKTRHFESFCMFHIGLGPIFPILPMARNSALDSKHPADVPTMSSLSVKVIAGGCWPYG